MNYLVSANLYFSREKVLLEIRLVLININILSEYVSVHSTQS